MKSGCALARWPALVMLGAALAAVGCAATEQKARIERRMPAEQRVRPREESKAMEWVLCPTPRQLKVWGAFEAMEGGPLTFQNQGDAGECPTRLCRAYMDSLAALPPGSVSAGTVPEKNKGWGDCALRPQMTLRIDAKGMPHAQGYDLQVRRRGITVLAHDEAGLFYAAQTLKQIIRQLAPDHGWPELHVVDWPDYVHRGILLDVSRDKVPTMETLCALVDKMAECKLNQLQLYTEHTFAYRDHHLVWEDASPMTPGDVRALDEYCRARFIDFVPNQNSFGHLHRWLKFPEYRHLGEMPEGGNDLCPVDPACVEFLRGLYADLLPNFSSDMVNVCCDETWSLGKGRSKGAVQQRGVGRVYLEFLLRIREMVRAHGKRMQFWGDIIMQHPELIPELPKDLIALEWGYEAEHPFAEHGKRFAEAGISFYVAPGTSSWNSLVGRTDNAMANLRNAAVNGLANGAVGYLITDWGDGGHWQFLPVSYAPFLYGASLSWCVESNQDLDIPRALDTHVFEDSAHVMGRLAYDLGNAYQKTGVLPANSTVFYGLLQRAMEKPLGDTWLKGLTVEALENTIAYVNQVMSPIGQARMACVDAEQITAEFELGAALVRFACRLGIARLKAGGVATSELPTAVRQALGAELCPLIPEFRQLWLARNRSGGLKDSAGRFESLATVLSK